MNGHWNIVQLFSLNEVSTSGDIGNGFFFYVVVITIVCGCFTS